MPDISIVVINDDPIYLETIREQLTHAGYPQISVHRGVGAFYYVRREEPSLILLDISVAHPHRGWQTLDVLRMHPATRDIPVIITATDGRILREKAEMLRALRCDSLEKPFLIEDILAKIAGMIGPPPSPPT